jgi:hypothetical protein
MRAFRHWQRSNPVTCLSSRCNGAVFQRKRTPLVWPRWTPETGRWSQRRPCGGETPQPGTGALWALKEASIFLPSATMANAIACRLHTKPGEAIICDERCHILNSETGGLAVHSGVVPRIVRGHRGHFTPEQVAEQLTLSGHYRPSPRCWRVNRRTMPLAAPSGPWSNCRRSVRWRISTA